MTATTKHTPGPWRVGPVDDTVILAADGAEIAAIDGDYNTPEQWPIMEANARLIAAAPDLLDACEFALIILEGMGNGAGGAANACRAALAKARGEG